MSEVDSQKNDLLEILFHTKMVVLFIYFLQVQGTTALKTDLDPPLNKFFPNFLVVCYHTVGVSKQNMVLYEE